MDKNQDVHASEWEKAREHVESLSFEEIKTVYEALQKQTWGRETMSSYRGVSMDEWCLLVSNNYLYLCAREENKKMFGRKLEIRNIHRGKGGRCTIVYGELIDADTGELILGATLDYISERLTAAASLATGPDDVLKIVKAEI